MKRGGIGFVFSSVAEGKIGVSLFGLNVCDDPWVWGIGFVLRNV